MTLGELPAHELRRLAAAEGVAYCSGPFTIRLRTDLPELLTVLQRLYPGLPLAEPNSVSHYHIAVLRKPGVRGVLRPQVEFFWDGETPFEPYPREQALPMLEWGLNWCIATSAHNYVLLHSAVVAKQGIAVLLPAMPGSGKTTLSVALAQRGWRLLSDEFGILCPRTGAMVPFPRAAPLKNQSIPLMQDFAPQAVFGPTFDNTRKGRVRHIAPSGDSIAAQQAPVVPGFVVFPRFQQGVATTLKEAESHLAFTRLVNNSFNYPVTGELGFRTLVNLLRTVRCYDLPNGDLHAAVAAIDALVPGPLS